MPNDYMETDIGIPVPNRRREMSVTNEDLRNDITRLTEIVRQLTVAISDLKVVNKDRQDEKDKVVALYAGLSVLRWAVGLVAVYVMGACIWTFNNVTEAVNTNRNQEIRISNNEQANHIQDARLQALERGQFAEHIKGDK